MRKSSYRQEIQKFLPLISLQLLKCQLFELCFAAEKSNKYNKLKSTFKNSDKKIKLFENILHLVKKIIGIKYYYILVRFMSVYARFENHKFLVKK
jgi:hypothetical protein